jgi:hypothetical protein
MLADCGLMGVNCPMGIDSRCPKRGKSRPGRTDSRSGHVRYAAHHAAARSSLSIPRATIIKSVSGKGRCSALASSHGARMRQCVFWLGQFRDVFRRIAQRDQRLPAR